MEISLSRPETSGKIHIGALSAFRSAAFDTEQNYRFSKWLNKQQNRIPHRPRQTE